MNVQLDESTARSNNPQVSQVRIENPIKRKKAQWLSVKRCIEDGRKFYRPLIEKYKLSDPTELTYFSYAEEMLGNFRSRCERLFSWELKYGFIQYCRRDKGWVSGAVPLMMFIDHLMMREPYEQCIHPRLRAVAKDMEGIEAAWMENIHGSTCPYPDTDMMHPAGAPQPSWWKRSEDEIDLKRPSLLTDEERKKYLCHCDMRSGDNTK